MYYREMHSKFEEEMIEFSLDSQVNKTGDIWHISVEVVSLLPFLIILAIVSVVLYIRSKYIICFQEKENGLNRAERA